MPPESQGSDSLQPPVIVGAIGHGLSRIGKYNLIAHIGSGGMADVYLATADSLSGFQKLVALKVMRPALAAQQEALRSFVDEARLAARLNHPNVLQTFETGRDNQMYFLVMEYLEGCSLGTLRRAAGKKSGMPLSMHLWIITETLRGLHYAHELKDFSGQALNIVHRDVSSHNVFLTYDGQVKTLDFGIAKATGNVNQTRSGVIKGTMRYIAPEAWLEAPVDRRADIYSAGVLLWEAVAGQPLWHNMSEAKIMRSVLEDGVPDLIDVRPNTPNELREICKKATCSKVQDRYATAKDFQDDLASFIAGSKSKGSTVLAELLDELLATRKQQTRGVIQNRIAELQEAQRTGRDGDTAMISLSSDGTASGLQSNAVSQGAATHSRTGVNYEQKTSKRWLLIASAATLSIGALVVFFLQHRPQKTEARPPTLAAPSQDSKPSKPVRRIEMSIEATPREAKLTLDGRALPPPPLAMYMPHDKEQHWLEVTAPGHHSRMIELTFDNDIDLHVDLKPLVEKEAIQEDTDKTRKIRKKRRRPTRAEEPKQPSKTTETPTPPPKKPSMTIETSNPYH